jgi:acyl carrier protein
MPDVKDRIRSFVLANYLPGESPENLTDTTPLQSSGILDSLAVLGLANFIKDEFGVDLGVHDMTMERFDRIEEIAQTIETRRAVQTSAG